MGMGATLGVLMLPACLPYRVWDLHTGAVVDILTSDEASQQLEAAAAWRAAGSHAGPPTAAEVRCGGDDLLAGTKSAVYE